MGIFDKFKKTKDGEVVSETEVQSMDNVVSEKVVEKKESSSKSKVVKKEDKVVAYKNSGDAYKVLLAPLVTEKASAQEKLGKYSFKVSGIANKVQIKKAINRVYGVDVVKVNIVNMKGKSVTFKRTKGRQKSWTKAVVTLKKGSTIDYLKPNYK